MELTEFGEGGECNREEGVGGMTNYDKRNWVFSPTTGRIFSALLKTKG